MRVMLREVGVGVVVVMAWSCNAAAPDPTDTLVVQPAVAAVMPVRTEGPTATAVPERFTYQPVGKRDPFRSVPDDIFCSVGDELHGLLPGFDLEQLTLVAVLTDGTAPVAMVQDPAGGGHVVRPGMLIGREGNLIRTIERGTVMLERRIRLHDGRFSTVIVPWTLDATRDHG